MTAPRNFPWEGGDEHAQTGGSADAAHREHLARQRGEEIVIANEFAEVRVCRVETRNGSRLLIESPKSGRWIALCPLEVEALTWQNTETFSAMIGQPFAPLTDGDASQ